MAVTPSARCRRDEGEVRHALEELGRGSDARELRDLLHGRSRPRRHEYMIHPAITIAPTGSSHVQLSGKLAARRTAATPTPFVITSLRWSSVSASTAGDETDLPTPLQ